MQELLEYSLSFFSLSIPERMSRERESEQCGQSTTSFIFDNIHGGIGAIVNVEGNISKGCWSGAGAGLLGWAQAVFQRDETHLIPSIPSD